MNLIMLTRQQLGMIMMIMWYGMWCGVWFGVWFGVWYRMDLMASMSCYGSGNRSRRNHHAGWLREFFRERRQIDHHGQ